MNVVYRLLPAAALALPLLAACGRQEPPPVNKGPVQVSIVTVAARDVPAVFEYVAQTQSSRQVNIQARVNGFLDKRVYTEGSIVKAGQVLFLMDMKPFQAQVDAAKAQLSKSQAAVDVAKANLDRVKPLAEQEALSQKDLDDATGNYREHRRLARRSARPSSRPHSSTSPTARSPRRSTASPAPPRRPTEPTSTSRNSQLTTVAVLSPMWVNFSLSENEFQAFRDQVEKGLLQPRAHRQLRGRNHAGRRLGVSAHRARSRSPTRPTTRRPARS